MLQQGFWLDLALMAPRQGCGLPYFGCALKHERRKTESSAQKPVKVSFAALRELLFLQKLLSLLESISDKRANPNAPEGFSA